MLYRFVDNPAESWTKDEVKIWFDSVCKDLDIDEKIVSQFTLMNGKGLNMLQKEDWLSQFPAHVGGLLFRLWNDLKNEANVNDQNIGTDTKKETKSGMFTSVTINQQKSSSIHACRPDDRERAVLLLSTS